MPFAAESSACRCLSGKRTCHQRRLPDPERTSVRRLLLLRPNQILFSHAADAIRSASPPVVPGTPSTAICSGLPVPRGPAILSRMGTNRARPFTAHRSGQRRSGRRKHARKPTGSPSRRGTSACSAFKVRRSHRRRWVTRSTPGMAISKCDALAATRTKPWRSTSCGDQRQRRSMNLSDTCGARIAQRFGRSVQAQPSGGAANTKITASDPPSTWWPGER